MNREKVFEVLRLISDVYPNFDFDQNKIDTWARLLKNQNPAVIMRNAENYVINNKFPPSIYDLYSAKKEAHSNDFLKIVVDWEREAVGHKPRG